MLNNHPLFNQGYKIFFALVLALSIANVAGNIVRQPVEDHEAFVLATAQSMLDRQDWVVPQFNDEVRLTKPPMQYWLTAATAMATGDAQDIQPWHGRFPSMLAGLGLVALTMLLGRKIYDARHAVLAGLMLATSTGYWIYAANARPEMLYAFFCMGAVTTYIYAQHDAPGSPRHRVTVTAGWLLLGLATLTKGPQIPAILLLVFCFDQYRKTASLKAVAGGLYLVPGLMLLLLLTLPWWWLLHSKVGSLQNTQLGGALLKPGVHNMVDPYYFYRPFQLMLPWILLLPLLFFTQWRQAWQKMRFLAVLILVSMLALSLGPQKRWYYMLPLLSPMFIVFAAGLLSAHERFSNKSWMMALNAVFIIVPLLVVAIVNTPLVQNKQRMATQALAKTAGGQALRGRDIILMDISASEIFIYYAHRKVFKAENLADLINIVQQYPDHRFIVVCQNNQLQQLSQQFEYQQLEQARLSAHSALALLEISRYLRPLQ